MPEPAVHRLAARAAGIAAPGGLPAPVAEAVEGLVVNGLSQLLRPEGPHFGPSAWLEDEIVAAGIAIHRDDFDDTDPVGGTHPTAPLLPAAIGAVRLRTSPIAGSQFLSALAAGYEVMGRLSRTAPHVLTRTGFHATSVFGALGAAVSAGVLLDLDEARLADAMGIAASQASGVIQSVAEGGDLKLFHGGWAAVAGLHAARWAARGVLTPPDLAIEGPYGLLNGFARRPGLSIDLEALDLEGFTLESIEAKRYPCCHFLHAAIELLLEFRRDHPEVAVEDIEAIRCTLPTEAKDVVCEPRDLRLAATGYDRKFSLPQVAALVVTQGVPGLDWFTDAVESPALAERVEHRLTDDVELRLGYGAEVEVVVAGRTVFAGRRVSAGSDRTAAMRDREFLQHKFRSSLVAHGFDADDADRRLAVVGGVGHAVDVAALLDQLLAPAG